MPLTRIIITALVALVVSGPAWAGAQEIKDCESLIQTKLKFYGSFKREYVVKDRIGIHIDAVVAFREANENFTISSPTEYWIVFIEFTTRTEDNSIPRRIGNCYLGYEKGGLFTCKKLKYSLSTIKFN